MCGVDQIVLLFFNNVSKIPIVNQMISSHKMMYNIFGSGISHKPHSVFKFKSQEFHNGKIGLFSVNETKMDGYFVGMNIDLHKREFLQATISPAEFIIIPMNKNSPK